MTTYMGPMRLRRSPPGGGGHIILLHVPFLDCDKIQNVRFSLNQSGPNSFPKGANSDNVKTPGVQLFHHVVLLMYFSTFL